MKKTNVILILLFILCLGAAVVFSIPGLIPFPDGTAGKLVQDTVPRLSALIFIVALMVSRGYTDVFRTQWRGRDFLWALPCFAVVLVNFPYSALISGEATIIRTDLIALFLLKCAAIALFEEIIFRGIILSAFPERWGKLRPVFAVLISSALFALMHLINLFFGAGIGATLLQVGYTFLIGCMLAVTMLKTKNLWLCVLLHAIFDVGGLIVADLGAGSVHDLVFWILNAVFGVLCAVHIIWTGVKLVQRTPRSS